MSDQLETNLANALADMDYGKLVPDATLAQVWAPALSKKLHHLDTYHRELQLSPAVHHMVQSWHRLVDKYHEAGEELKRLKNTATVWYSTQWVNIPVSSTSSQAISKVPYSGTPAILRAILLNSDLTPVGGFANLNMAGIEFVNPTSDGNVVQYSTAPGVDGTPTQRFMDPTPFLHTKTAPWGGREVQFWVDWVLDPAAQIITSWVNPDPLNEITVSVNYIFTSTPCAGMMYQNWYHRSHHSEISGLLNRIHTSVFGLQQGGMAVPYHSMGITGPMHQLPGHSQY